MCTDHILAISMLLIYFRSSLTISIVGEKIPRHRKIPRAYRKFNAFLPLSQCVAFFFMSVVTLYGNHMYIVNPWKKMCEAA